ncbi:MAG TPA: 5-methyltetrahydropteroyltriglutamate--homocysteine S-methyltransferase, partial [Jiangellaceae bacterium]|nr:5-methyltetrahydropteroyltriglutamate--homocysteine S-methyltransferase [Jiangellaceae bacterium]
MGSLLRPEALLTARAQHAAGEIDDDALRAIEDEAIRDVVAMQRDVGLRTATDGEFRRASWHMDFIYQLDGIHKAEGEIKVPMRNEDGVVEFTSAAMRVDGKVGLDAPIFGEHFTFLAETAAATGLTPKLTIPSPSMVHYRGG